MGMQSGIEKFRKFGPGVYLMFSFLKWMLILMSIAAVFALPMVVLLLESPHYRDSAGLVRIGLMRLTIASL